MDVMTDDTGDFEAWQAHLDGLRAVGELVQPSRPIRLSSLVPCYHEAYRSPRELRAVP